MVCVYCGGKTQVTNSRPQRRDNNVWRRRECVLCDTVFSSLEAPDYSKSLLVGGRPGATKRRELEAFSRDRLLLSLYKSLSHRPTALDDAGGLCATIIAKLTPNAHNGVIDSQTIIQTTVVALTRFDKLAAQHYQAVHKNELR